MQEFEVCKIIVEITLPIGYIYLELCYVLLQQLHSFVIIYFIAWLCVGAISYSPSFFIALYLHKWLHGRLGWLL